KPSNLRRIHKTPPLYISEPCRYAQDHVGDRKLELSGSSLLDFAQEHGNKLSCCESLLLTQVCDLRTDLAINIDESRRDIFLLDLYIRIVEFPACQPLQ